MDLLKVKISQNFEINLENLRIIKITEILKYFQRKIRF